MRRGEWHVQEERGVGVLVQCLAYELRGILADRSRVIEVRPRILGLVAARERDRIVEGARTVNGAEELVEPALHRPVGAVDLRSGPLRWRDMPLAAHQGRVAGRLHDLGESDAALVEIPHIGRNRLAILAKLAHHVPHARLVRVQPRDQRGTRRAAAGVVVERAEAQTAGGEAVEHGRVDLAAVTADVGEAHVIRHRDDDVGPLCGTPSVAARRAGPR